MVHPASQSCTTEMREWFASPGRMRANLAFGGSMGQSISQSCDDLMVCPFGRTTVTGLFVGRLLRIGALTERKCPVVPESSIAVSEGRKLSGIVRLFVIVVFSSSSIMLAEWLQFIGVGYG